MLHILLTSTMLINSDRKEVEMRIFTSKNAIDKLKQYSSDINIRNGKTINLAIQMAIKALEMQLPSEIGENLGDYEKTYFCTKCNGNVNYEHQQYCRFCGQKLDW